MTTVAPELPPVAMWRIHALRLVFLLMATYMGFGIWQQILFEPEPWPLHRMMSKSMLGALAVVALLGVRYPLQMLPLMLFEIVWKTTYILAFYTPAWLANAVTPELQSLFESCIGIIVAYLFMPWRYFWARYFRYPSEPWRTPG
jgi:hypothetical protein